MTQNVADMAQNPGAAALAGRSLTREYPVPGRRDASTQALAGVDVAVAPGSFTAIVGPSGSGKSTLLHCLAGLDEPTSGQVWLAGADLTAMKRRARAAYRASRVGFVFQDYNLISSLTALDNVLLPARLTGTRITAAEARDALAVVGLADRATLRPHQLSGGERQRVAIARVLAAQPAIVFADEPTGALDLAAAQVVLGWLCEVVAGGSTVVMVTHDVGVAARAERILVMGQGKLVESLAGGDADMVAAAVRRQRTEASA